MAAAEEEEEEEEEDEEKCCCCFGEERGQAEVVAINRWKGNVREGKGSEGAELLRFNPRLNSNAHCQGSDLCFLRCSILSLFLCSPRSVGKVTIALAPASTATESAVPAFPGGL